MSSKIFTASNGPLSPRTPQMNTATRDRLRRQWLRAVERSFGWVG